MTIITLSFLKHTRGGFVSLVNIHGPKGTPCGSTANLKKTILHKILKIFSLFQISSQSIDIFYVYAGHATMGLDQICIHFKAVVFQEFLNGLQI